MSQVLTLISLLKGYVVPDSTILNLWKLVLLVGWVVVVSEIQVVAS